MKYSEPRYTKDPDVWVHNSRQNSLRMVEALKKFGAPVDHDKVTAETFTRGKWSIRSALQAPRTYSRQAMKSAQMSLL